MATRVSVKTVRARLGLNREDFGALFPVHSRTVRRWENGEVAPSPMASKQIKALDQDAKSESGPKRRSDV